MDVSQEAGVKPWYEWEEAPPAEFAVIGDPVAHSLSPRMQTAAMLSLELPHRYLAIRVPAGEFESALSRLESLAYIGLNVTVPLKELAFAWALRTDELTSRIQAANTIRLTDRSATNTDAPGFLDVLAELGLTPPQRVLLIGAGGAARAVAAALARANFPFSVYNRSRSKAEGMLAEMGIPAQVLSAPDPHGFALIVNATSASLSGANVEVDWNRAVPNAIAMDLAYAEAPTPFVAQASSYGLRALDGKALLAAQGARSLEWWLDVPAPRSAMLKAIA
jgi:shikimate dehydrogenase